MEIILPSPVSESFLFGEREFKRVKRCIKDHVCSFCGATIPRGSAYFISKDMNPPMEWYVKACLNCLGDA